MKVKKRISALITAITFIFSTIIVNIPVYADEETIYYQDYESFNIGDVASGVDGMTFNSSMETYVKVEEADNNKYLKIGKTGTGSVFNFEKNISNIVGNKENYMVEFKLKLDYTANTTANFVLGSCFAFRPTGSGNYSFEYHNGSDWVKPEGLIYNLSSWRTIKLVINNRNNADIYMDNELIFAAVPKRGIYTFDKFIIQLNSSLVGNVFLDNFTVKEYKEEMEPMPITPETKPVVGTPPVSKDNFDIFLAIGQSNMAGRANVEDEDKYTIPGAYLLNADGKWETAQVQYNGSYWQGFNRYSTVADPKKIQGLGPTVYFAKTLTEALVGSGKAIGIVSNARGDTSIEKWQKGYSGEDDHDLYEEAVARAQIAMQTGTLRGILWHQGCANINSKDYTEKFIQLINDLRADLGIPDLAVIVGEIPGFGDTQEKISKRMEFNRTYLRTLPNYVDNCYFISSAGSRDIGDKTHFDSASQRNLGRSYAEAALRNIYRIPKDEKAVINVVSTEASEGSLYTSAAVDGIASIYTWDLENTYWSAPIGSYFVAEFEEIEEVSEIKSYFRNPWNYTYQYKIYARLNNEWSLVVDKSAANRYEKVGVDGCVIDDLGGIYADAVKIEITGVCDIDGNTIVDGSVSAACHEFVILSTKSISVLLYSEDFESYNEGIKISDISSLWTVTDNPSNTAEYRITSDDSGNKYAYLSTCDSTVSDKPSLFLNFNFSSLLGSTGKYTVEFKYMPVWGTSSSVGFVDGPDGTLRYKSAGNLLTYHNGTIWVDDPGKCFVMEYNVWYKMRLIFDQDNLTWNLYINGSHIYKDVPLRTDKSYKQWIRFYHYQSPGGFAIDEFKFYSGETAESSVIKALSYDFNSYETNMKTTLGVGAKQYDYNFVNVDAGNISLDAVKGKFGKDEADTSLFIRNDSTAVDPSKSVDAYVDIIDSKNYLRVGPRESFMFSMNFAFDEKFSAPIFVNGRAHSYYEGNYNDAKAGGSDTMGYFLRIYPDRINIWGKKDYYFDTACVAEKWYNIKVITTAGSLDGTIPTTFSAYLDDQLICENVVIGDDFQLRFDSASEIKYNEQTFVTGAPILGLKRIWLNYNVKAAQQATNNQDGTISYTPGGAYFDNVEYYKYPQGVQVNPIFAKISCSDSELAKYKTGLTSYVNNALTVDEFDNTLETTNIKRIIYRDKDGMQVADSSLAGGAYYEAITTSGTKLYGKVISENKIVYTNSGLLGDEWKNFNRSVRTEKGGLGGKPSENIAFALTGPFAQYEETGNYNDFIYYEIQNNSNSNYVKFSNPSAYMPITIEASVCLSGYSDSGIMLRTFEDGVGGLVTFIWFSNGEIRVNDENGNKVIVGKYKEGQWIRTSVTVYPGRETVDIRVNGKLVMENSKISTRKPAYVSQVRFAINVDGPKDENTFIAIDDVNIYTGFYIRENQLNVTAIDGLGAVVDNMNNVIILPEDIDTSYIPGIMDYIVLEGGHNVNIYTDRNLSEPAQSLDNRPVLVYSDGVIYKYYTLCVGTPDNVVFTYSINNNILHTEAELYNVDKACLIMAAYSGNKELLSIKDVSDISFSALEGELEIPANTSHIKLMCWDSLEGMVPIGVLEINDLD